MDIREDRIKMEIPKWRKLRNQDYAKEHGFVVVDHELYEKQRKELNMFVGWIALLLVICIVAFLYQYMRYESIYSFLVEHCLNMDWTLRECVSWMP